MNVDIRNGLKQSAQDFKEIVWPAISPEIGGGILEPVESVTSSGFVKILDTLSGVDAWQVIHGKGVRAIASRVQRPFSDMQTFTIRLRTRFGSDETEFAKINRIRDLWDKGFLSAGLVVQAYLKDPACAYIVRAQDLYPRIRLDAKGRRRGFKSVEGGLWFEQPVSRGEVMAVFPIAALQSDGCNVLRVPIAARAAA